MAPTAEIVEVATPEQLEQVRSLIRDYQSQLPARYCFPNDEWLNLPGEYAPPKGAMLLATVAGRAAGCVGLRPFPMDGTCEMKRLYVDPRFRGYSLGKALIEQILSIARRQDYSRVRLDTHPVTMQAAVGLYRRLGFAEVSPGPLTPVDGLWYMELRL